jgi:radical SAM superfamily enzyme YgiQ (UPF0313 family)
MKAPSKATVMTAVPKETLLYAPSTPEADAVRVGWFYPAANNIAMSALGWLLLFRQMDESPRVAVERVTLDTVKDCDPRAYELIGFSVAWELDFLNILPMLEAVDLPFYAAERPNDAPLLFAGGPVIMTNPEPYAPFLIGEGEELLSEVMAAIHRLRNVPDKQEKLHRLAVEVPGVYVPSLYEVAYASPDGPIARIEPVFDDLPFPIKRRWIENMDDFVAYTPILAEDTVFSNTFLVEVMRGCAHRCRFCLASYSTLPARGPSLAAIQQTIERGLRHTKKIGLLGALIADHPQFDELCQWLDGFDDVEISSASLRADTLTPQICKTFKKGGQRQLTIAVESGSERLRRRINKNLKHEEILAACQTMASAGLEGVKLYGMVGLPDETEDDVAQLAALVKEIRREVQKFKVTLGCSSFVPKAATPFQWMARMDATTINKRFEILRKGTLKIAEFRPQSAKWDFIQALLSRGDRRLAPLLIAFYRLGGSLGALNRAYKDLERSGELNFPDADWYATRERPEDEVLPWDVLHLGVDKRILYKEGLPPPGFHERFAVPV